MLSGHSFNGDYRCLRAYGCPESIENRIGHQVDWPAFMATHPVMLAPMAGVTDPVMRKLCLEQGASLTFTEMVSAKGLSYENQRTEDLLTLSPDETQVGVQLFGHEPATMAHQAARVREMLGEALAVIDINMGCPARKIITKGDGSALMQQPDRAVHIVAAVVDAVDVPVTVKMRRGFALGCETAGDLARRVEQAGAAGVTVHGRFAQQLYRGTSCHATIRRVKEAVAIPVVGNGDVCCGADAVTLMRETACDAIMIARAAEGNPWVFADVAAALAGKPAPQPPSLRERVALARRHARELYRWEPRTLVRMRKQGSWYCKGQPGASQAREALNRCRSLAEFEAAFDEMDRRLDELEMREDAQ